MSLRVISPQADKGARVHAAEASSVVDSYMERLVKLVPAEAIAAYPLLEPLAETAGNWAVPVLSWVLLGVVGVLRWHATSTPQSGPQWTAVVIACVSFVIWVYVMDGHFGVYSFFALFYTDGDGAFRESIEAGKSFLSTLALVVWTLLVPVFYKGDSA